VILRKQHSILPGFGLTLGCSVLYLCVIVMVPLLALVLKSAQFSWQEFAAAVWSPRSIASYHLTLGTAFCGALINAVFGFLVAWVLVRYDFPFKKLVDGMVDLPFALPTAVAGITLTALYCETGLIGRIASVFGIRIAYTPLGIITALTFIGLPFVVRTVQPVLQDLDLEIEEASASLGANRLQTFVRVLMPEVMPALLTGFALAFARALGEYGSVIFIAGNMPMKTEITSLLIMIKLEQYDYAGATSIALVFLMASFAMLFVINVLQRRAIRKQVPG